VNEDQPVEVEALRGIVDRVPQFGWPVTGSQEAFVKLAIRMRQNHFSLNEIENLLTAAYYAVACQYGDEYEE
jgi:hypothetical protein